jgi:hypothetical protein
MSGTLVEDLGGRPRAWGLEAVLEGFVGLTAFPSGLLLAFFAHGSKLVPLSLLEDSPFRTFLIPGLLLAFVVGGLNLLAAVLTISKSPWSSLASLFAGGSLVVFIVTESLLVKGHSPLQLLYFSLGLAIALLSLPKPEGKTP